MDTGKAAASQFRVAGMTDLQLLTYLLTLSGTDETAARTAAHTLLDSYDNLSTVLALPRSTLVSDPRLDENSGAFLALVGAMSFRYANRFHRSDLVVTDQETVRRLLAPHLKDREVERVCVICVDADFHLLGSGAIVTGSERDNVALPVQRLLTLALSSNAYGVILAHSHPDGIPRFSQADLMTTDALRTKLAVVGVSLLDHYLWAGDQVVSLYDQLSQGVPPLDRWNIAELPLLSRLDPQAFLSHRKSAHHTVERTPFYLRNGKEIDL